MKRLERWFVLEVATLDIAAPNGYESDVHDM